MKFFKVFQKTKNQWWAPLRINEDPFKNKSASWLELFFDLVYIVTIGYLSHSMYLGENYIGIAFTIINFIVIFIYWREITFFNTVFEKDSVRLRVIILFGFFPLILLIGYLNSVHLEDSLGEILGNPVYLSVVTFIKFQVAFKWGLGYFEVARNQFQYKVIIRLYFLKAIILLFIFALLTIISFFLTISPIILAILLIFEFFDIRLLFRGISKGKKYFLINRDFPLLKHYIVERYGLFVMLLFGEVVMQLLINISLASFKIVFVEISYFILIFQMWWIYYDNVSISEFKDDLLSLSNWIITNVILMLGLVSLSAVVAKTADGAVQGIEYHIILNSVIIFFIGIILMNENIDYNEFTRFNSKFKVDLNRKKHQLKNINLIVTFILFSLNFYIVEYLIVYLNILLLIVIVNGVYVFNKAVYEGMNQDDSD